MLNANNSFDASVTEHMFWNFDSKIFADNSYLYEILFLFSPIFSKLFDVFTSVIGLLQLDKVISKIEENAIKVNVFQYLCMFCRMVDLTIVFFGFC